MKHALAAVWIGAALLSGCGDSSGTDSDSPIAGTWIATQLSAAQIGGFAVDVLGAGGSLSITIEDDNSTTGSLHIPAELNDGVEFNASVDGTASLNTAQTEVTFTHPADTFVRDLTWHRVGTTSLRVIDQTAGGFTFNVTLTKQ
jgi:hypothetical protein